MLLQDQAWPGHQRNHVAFPPLLATAFGCQFGSSLSRVAWVTVSGTEASAARCPPTAPLMGKAKLQCQSMRYKQLSARSSEPSMLM